MGLSGHDGWVNRLVFHHNGKYLISASDDKIMITSLMKKTGDEIVEGLFLSNRAAPLNLEWMESNQIKMIIQISGEGGSNVAIFMYVSCEFM